MYLIMNTHSFRSFINFVFQGSKSVKNMYGALVIPSNNDHIVSGQNVEYGILSCENQPFKAIATTPPFFVR